MKKRIDGLDLTFMLVVCMASIVLAHHFNGLVAATYLVVAAILFLNYKGVKVWKVLRETYGKKY